MDFIKKAGESFSNKDERKEGDKPAEQKDDYVDKGTSTSCYSTGVMAMLGIHTDNGQLAFAFASDKAGLKVDRQTQEKITDGGRDAYEKYSGYVSKRPCPTYNCPG
jgi:hypothetical protein